MIVLVPLSRFRIPYDVAAGRPFSELERLIMRAIREGATGVSALLDVFEVHPRLLIESLVTLTYAGWLSVGGAGHEGLVLTLGGTEAAASDEPPSTIKVSSRQTSVVMERVTGALISNQEVQFVSRREMASVWDKSVRLPADVTGNQLDEGQVQHLLPLKQGEWIRWIYPVEMLTKDAHWLPVNVDLETDAVVGLPGAWLQRLIPTILAEAHRVAGLRSRKGVERSLRWPLGSHKLSGAAADDEDPDIPQVGPRGWPTTVSDDDFLFTAAEHENLAIMALSEVQTSILIASAFATLKKLDLLRESIVGALNRGVDVDLLWGYMDGVGGPPTAVLKWLRKLSYEATRGGRGLLRFNSRPSGSHGKLMLWDRPDGVSACVGSYNWLSVVFDHAEASLPRNVTIRTSEPAIVASLARCAAGFWSAAETETLSSTGDRWRRIASELDGAALRVTRPSTNAEVRLILDGEHEALLYDWTARAQSRLLVASHKLGPVSEQRLVNAGTARAGTFECKVVYGRSGRDDGWREGVARTIRGAGGAIQHVPGFHAKALIADDSSCVSSYNFLSADPYGKGQNAREIGLAVEGVEPADWLWRRVDMK